MPTHHYQKRSGIWHNIGKSGESLWSTVVQLADNDDNDDEDDDDDDDDEYDDNDDEYDDNDDDDDDDDVDDDDDSHHPTPGSVGPQIYFMK